METVLFILILVVLFILAFFVIPRWRMRRAIRQVVDIFRKDDTTRPSTAKTLEQLGLRLESGVSLSLFRRRDYKIYALDMLIRAEAIKPLEDGRLYLSEERLLELRL
jgi:Na+-transporting methylmalonyl-CoA/oxaloacetate decarboxylase gamma subunit